MKQNDLLYYNDFGGFSNDSKEYVINIKNGERTPAPWSHVIANEKFGTIITSNGGGYTWSNNSRENKITNWSNNQISDNSSEMIYIKTDNNIYSAMPETIKTDYTITYGFGYAVFETSYENIEQKLTIFVPDKKSEKISILKLKNNSNEKKKIKIFYKLDLVLGVNKEQTKKHIIIQKDGNVIEATNRYRENYSDETIFITCSDIISSATGEKEDFNLHDGIIKESFGIAKNPFATIETNICIEPYSEQTIYFSIGTYKRELFTNIDEELKNVSLYWKYITETIQVKTPVESMNIMMNGWLLYQTICCRLYARTSFYQCGGAFGFRDQLQDVIGIMTIKPEFAKKQILYHAEHQFVQGDVLHWWHPEKNNGIRSRYKDDLLWLPYVVYEYIYITGDNTILDEEVSYVCGKELKEDEDEIYEETKKTDFKENIYSHCIKAIEKSLDFGLYGLPQMGCGDWNDGMNKVGGESVWLGFFLYDILKKFSNICEQRGDISLKEKFLSKLNELKKSLNENAWDGKWYKRAFFKDGVALGTAQAEECKIDSISQSWAVISGAGDYEKIKIAMDSIENYLVDKENMVIKLLTPPFNQSIPNPGYISAYIPGIRENGGQYTHGDCYCGQFLANMLEIKPK